MAIRLATQFPANSTAPSAAYPGGSAKDDVTPGDRTGTPWVRVLLDDRIALGEQLLAGAAIAANDSADSVTNPQYMQALLTLIMAGEFYTDAGAVNVYTLNPPVVTGFGPVAYKNGMRIGFRALVTNTAASTVELTTVSSPVPILLAGVALTGGEIVAGALTEAIFDSGSGSFEITTPLPLATTNLIDFDNTPTTTTGDVPIWNNATSQYEPGPQTGGGGGTTLAALTDVDLTAPVAGQRFEFDGVDWINVDDTALDAFVKANVGYAKIKGGTLGNLIVQWGVESGVPGNTTSTTVVLPTSFNSAGSYGVAITFNETSIGASDDNVAINTKTASSFKITNDRSAATTVYWVVIGF